MTVKALIEALQEYGDMEATVLLSIDPEGNAFRVVEDLSLMDSDDQDIRGLVNKNTSAVCIWP